VVFRGKLEENVAEFSESDLEFRGRLVENVSEFSKSVEEF